MLVIYGAYGYTGQLLCRFAADYGLRPLLSGRSEPKLKSIAAKYHFDYQVADLDKPAELRDLLRDADVVLHAAGPFIHTARQMHDACLATGTHYLDITGEIPAFAAAAKRGAEAEQAGLMFMPGVGFDVVPTDCMAAYLKKQLPDAVDLKLAFAWKGGMLSHGTAKTMLEGLGEPGAVREHGDIKPVPTAYKTANFPFTAEKSLAAVTIPWGDVFTAYYTTGIPNIETYFAVPPSQIKQMQRSNYLGWFLRLKPVKNYLRKKIESKPAGPNDERRAAAETYVYGEAANVAGKRVAARLRTPEGYTLTAHTALEIARRVLAGDFRPGYQTPAGVYGADLILDFEGTHRMDVPVSVGVA